MPEIIKRRRLKIDTPRRMQMQNYVELQKERGHRQVKSWIPAHMVPWLNQIAAEARELHRWGKDPLDRLPKTILDKD
jgi:hypothetical protein